MKSVYLVDDGERHWISANSENSAIYDLCKNVYGYDDVLRYKYENEPDITILDSDYKISYYDDNIESEVTSTCQELANSISGVICSTIW